MILCSMRSREPDFSGLGPVPDAVRLRPNNPETFTLFMWWQDFTDGDMSWDSCEWFAREEVEIKTNRVCLIMSGTVATKPIEVADMGGDDLGNVDQGVEDDGILGSVSGADGGSDCSQTRAEPNIWAVLLLFGLFVRTKRN